MNECQCVSADCEKMSNSERENENLNNLNLNTLNNLTHNLEKTLEDMNLEANRHLREARDLREATARMRDQAEKIRALQPKADDKSDKADEKWVICLTNVSPNMYIK